MDVLAPLKLFAVSVGQLFLKRNQFPNRGGGQMKDFFLFSDKLLTKIRTF